MRLPRLLRSAIRMVPASPQRCDCQACVSLAKAKLEADAGTPVSTQPSQADEGQQTEPTSSTDIAPQFSLDIQGKPFVQFAGLLALAHSRGLVSLTADFITVAADLALAHAVATFADGRTFAESGDATPDNVDEAALVQRIFRLYVEGGRSMYAIAALL